MKAWHFTEQSYTPAWTQLSGVIRIEPPSELIDPEIISDTLNRYLDEWCLADELGLNIMVNEHHSSMSSVSPSVMMHLMVLARQTKNVRLLALGVPLTNRMDPVRIAEEVALVDVISRGRVELGLVKGVPWELFSSNQNPVGLMDRYWEAHDLILKTLTTHDGPFNWEGQHFQYRAINIYPRCYQQPAPPMWIPGSSPGTARLAARKGYIFATFLAGHAAKEMFAAYRDEYLKVHGVEAPLDRLGYLSMTAVGNSEAEGRQRGEAMAPYLATVTRVPPATAVPPGYLSVPDHSRLLQMGKAGMKHSVKMSNGEALPAGASLEQLADAGLLMCGTPDQVYSQIESFYDAVGGFGHMISMGQAAYLNHADTADSMRLFANEVMPRLQHLTAAHAEGVAA